MTERVNYACDDTIGLPLALVQTQGLTMTYLPEQRDLDTLKDFKHWRESLG
jgi:hypothetical protein